MIHTIVLVGGEAVVEPDPDLMAAQPELMLAAAAAYETAAHIVNSVGSATGRAAKQSLAEWQGRGAQGFAHQVSYLATATPDAAAKLLAVATALRVLAPAISQAQALARQAMTMREQAVPVAAAAYHTPLTAIRARAAIEDLTAADTMTIRANTMGQEAWDAASRAFNAISAASTTATPSATLTSLTTSQPAHRPHDEQPKVSPDQVRLITDADGQRVYSFDGGLKIPAGLPGAHRLVEGIKGYLPRYLAGHTGDIEVPAGLSPQHTWYEVAYLYIITYQGTVPRRIREQFFTDIYSSITFKTAAGMSVLGAAGSITPAVGDNTVTGEQISKTDRALDPKGDPPASSVISARGLARQLAREEARGEASSIFTQSGELKPSVIQKSRLIISGRDLGNTHLARVLTSDGSNISDWGKYSTRTIKSPLGPFPVHFYYNSSTGDVYYGMDYKAVFSKGMDN